MKRQYSPQTQRMGLLQMQSVPSPTGGWNTRDARSMMPTEDAIILDNFIPGTGSVDARGGYTAYASGLSTNVETLVEYYSGSVRSFLGAAGSEIYDITSPGTAVSLASGFNSARWNTMQFGGRLFFFNGSDIPQFYNGSTINPTAFTGSGLNVQNLLGASSYKNRLFLWEKDSQDFWYGGLNAVQGALTKFPLSVVGKRGGKMIAIVSLSRDSGDGADDYIAFIMTSEVFVYRGSDPGDAASFAIVGRYPIGEIVSDRAVIEYDGDVKIVTKSDLVSLRDICSLSPDDIVKSKLSGAFSAAARSYSNNFGWQGVFYPRSNWLLFNVPITTNVNYHQYGINTITGGAFRFTGWNARCFGTYNNRLYFGSGNGIVYLADDGQSDNGANITVVGQKAFDPLGSFRKKAFTQVRPLIRTDGDVQIGIGLAFDYGEVSVNQTAPSTSTGSPWDTSPWDTSPWSPEDQIRTNTYGAVGVGETVSVKLAATLNGQGFSWFQTDYGYKQLTKFQ